MSNNEGSGHHAKGEGVGHEITGVQTKSQPDITSRGSTLILRVAQGAHLRTRWKFIEPPPPAEQMHDNRRLKFRGSKLLKCYARVLGLSDGTLPPLSCGSMRMQTPAKYVGV